MSYKRITIVDHMLDAVIASYSNVKNPVLLREIVKCEPPLSASPAVRRGCSSSKSQTG